MMNASYAANLGLDGTGVRIAVIDSGVNPAFNDFEIDTVIYDSIFNDGVYYDSNISNANHGTYVASIIAGKHNNGIGANGIAPEAAVVSIKVFNSIGCTIENVIKAINRAVDTYGCHIINLSLGVPIITPLSETQSNLQQTEVLLWLQQREIALTPITTRLYIPLRMTMLSASALWGLIIHGSTILPTTQTLTAQLWVCMISAAAPPLLPRQWRRPPRL
jgi:hypothetical protein